MKTNSNIEFTSTMKIKALTNYMTIINYYKKPLIIRIFKKKPSMNIVDVCTEVIPCRRCGNTTRISNRIIEEVLSGLESEVMDHDHTTNSNKRLLDIVVDRLIREHGFKFKKIKIDSKYCYTHNCTKYLIRLS